MATYNSNKTVLGCWTKVLHAIGPSSRKSYYAMPTMQALRMPAALYIGSSIVIMCSDPKSCVAFIHSKPPIVRISLKHWSRLHLNQMQHKAFQPYNRAWYRIGRRHISHGCHLYATINRALLVIRTKSMDILRKMSLSSVELTKFFVFYLLSIFFVVSLCNFVIFIILLLLFLRFSHNCRLSANFVLLLTIFCCAHSTLICFVSQIRLRI